MIYIKCRLITGIIKKIITTVFKAIYKVLSVFNLQPLLFVLVVGLILFLTGTITDNPTVRTTFIVLIILSVVYAVIASLYKLFSLGRKKGKKMQIVDNRTGEVYTDNGKINESVPASYEQNVYSGQTATANEPVYRQTPTQNYPIYFTVRQNPKYFFAEYADRYELFYKSPNGIKHIRTDRKY